MLMVLLTGEEVSQGPTRALSEFHRVMAEEFDSQRRKARREDTLLSEEKRKEAALKVPDAVRDGQQLWRKFLELKRTFVNDWMPILQKCLCADGTIPSEQQLLDAIKDFRQLYLMHAMPLASILLETKLAKRASVLSFC